MRRPIEIFLFFALLLIMTAAMPELTLAIKSAGYVPPPYLVRVLRSALTIFPAACALAAAGWFIMSFFDRETCRVRWALYWFLTVLFSIAASFSAAQDGLNDELWNPALTGTWHLMWIPALTVLLLNRKMRWWLRVLIAAIVLILSPVAVGTLLQWWQELGRNIGLPTSW